MSLPPPPASSSTSNANRPLRPQGKGPAFSNTANTDAAAATSTPPAGFSDENVPQKKRRHRAGRKHKKRRPSFVPPSDAELTDATEGRPSLLNVPEDIAEQAPFYRIRQSRGMSDTSLDSEVLLDHRHHRETRQRRPSIVQSPTASRGISYFSSRGNKTARSGRSASRPKMDNTRDRNQPRVDSESEEDVPATDRTPLIPTKPNNPSRTGTGYGGTTPIADRPRLTFRRTSVSSSKSGRRKTGTALPRIQSSASVAEDYDVNNPSSMPGSPRIGGLDPLDTMDDPTFTARTHSPETTRLAGGYGSDAIIDIDLETSQSPPNGFHHRRRPTGQSTHEVCLPFDQGTEVGEEEPSHTELSGGDRRLRRRKRQWPDLPVLEEWALEEKDEREAKRVTEPELVGGRLRPHRFDWQQEIEDEPFRFTYYSDSVYETLRSHTISGLRQLGLSFEELFRPPPVLMDESSSEEEEELLSQFGGGTDRAHTPVNGQSRSSTRQASMANFPTLDAKLHENGPGPEQTGRSTPRSQDKTNGDAKVGPRPIFWLDVLQPTYEEMRVLSRAFGIHKLTAEDIMEQEAREKVELFRNYYFVNYRTFEQDRKKPDYMDPVNMSFVVFKGGVISFHFSQFPHPALVRRRIRQIREHQLTFADWVSYALIDNITDAYAPIIEEIEQEVDAIDDEILTMHSTEFDVKDSKGSAKDGGRKSSAPKSFYEWIARKSSGKSVAGGSDTESVKSSETQRDMLLRVGETRKKVMGLYRLLGNKADVIKGLAKRCNEQWHVAPRSDVGLYLGDIQDHILTMTGNLTHYENILSRAHSNYLAQINVRMNERAEQTNDVLGKLTILGTIVLPMNIVTGLFGSNFPVPGQTSDEDDLSWFWATTAFLALFGIICYFSARRIYGPL